MAALRLTVHPSSAGGRWLLWEAAAGGVEADRAAEFGPLPVCVAGRLQGGGGEVDGVGAEDQVQRGFGQFGDLDECAGNPVRRC
jgi:hypothetical protein